MIEKDAQQSEVLEEIQKLKLLMSFKIETGLQSCRSIVSQLMEQLPAISEVDKLIGLVQQLKNVKEGKQVQQYQSAHTQGQIPLSHLSLKDPKVSGDYSSLKMA